MKLLSKIGIFFFFLVIASAARAAEDPDALYRQGRFAEAEKAYAQYDMDHPRDIRFRYNRGCAAYRNSDYKGAMAAFSSVLKRAEDKEMRFRAAYNLGNAAYKLGDFRSAAAFYKEAIANNPSNEDAPYNLELALRALERQKEEQGSQPPDQPREDSKGEKGQGNQEKTAKDQEGSQDREAGKSESRTGQEKNPGARTGEGEDRGEKGKEKSPGDLSGQLKSLQGLQEEGKEGKEEGTGASGMDRKRAEALLDNVKEDRTRFLRFKGPGEKDRGAGSGKDW
jgi:Ca-activated chloride channel family protein